MGSLPNGVPEHEPCIFKFFLLPRLVTRIKEFKIKESVVVRQTRRRGMKMNLRIIGACACRAYSESLAELLLFSVASKFLILRPKKKKKKKKKKVLSLIPLL